MIIKAFYFMVLLLQSMKSQIVLSIAFNPDRYKYGLARNFDTALLPVNL